MFKAEKEWEEEQVNDDRKTLLVPAHASAFWHLLCVPARQISRILPSLSLESVLQVRQVKAPDTPRR
jgi:hypothetical protein